MRTDRNVLRKERLFVLTILVSFILGGVGFAAGDSPGPKSALDLASIPHKIVYESYVKTQNKENWDLMLISADGSNEVNLTKTPDVDEMYPHACPKGKRVCFVADEGRGDDKVRNVYYMNLDGSGRVKVADNARQACWGPDGKTIAYLKGEFDKYTIKDYATKGLFYYDVETGKTRQDKNTELHHLYNISWHPGGQWFAATVHGGMGFRHAVLVFRKDGDRVYDLTKFGVTGCRPDFDSTGKRITWGTTDWDLCTADIKLDGDEPVVSNVQKRVHCDKEHEIYHTDFSPDGRFITFSYGPEATEMVGGMAPGWNICISDMAGTWVQVTNSGNHCKEPDWVIVSQNP